MNQALIESGKNLLIFLGCIAALGLFALLMLTISVPLERLDEKLWYRKVKAQVEKIFYSVTLAACGIGLLVWIFSPLISFLIGNR